MYGREVIRIRDRKRANVKCPGRPASDAGEQPGGRPRGEQTREQPKMPGDKRALYKVQRPKFKMDNYKMYEIEVEMWTEMCEVEKKKQAMVLWMDFPRDHPSEINTKICQEIKEELKTEQGVTKLLEVMAKAFKLAEQNQVMKIFLDFFVNMKKNPKETMMDFVTRFVKTAIKAKNKGMELSKTALGLKIIHDATLSDSQIHLVLVEVNFENEDQVYERAKMGLNKTW